MTPSCYLDGDRDLIVGLIETGERSPCASCLKLGRGHQLVFPIGSVFAQIEAHHVFAQHSTVRYLHHIHPSPNHRFSQGNSHLLIGDVKRHSGHLGMNWSRPIDTSHSDALFGNLDVFGVQNNGGGG
uniref:Uncharacterized protein n=1 Tax=Cacopsylla melanoneura TaxID=428564 RepID=A0A8D8UAK2_9HEMI